MKNLRMRRLLSGILAVCLLCGLTACGGKDAPESSAVEPSDTTSSTTTTTTTPAPTLGLNILTGENDLTTGNNRPIGFVVPDESSKLVQLNLESADMYFEAETEAGIPRMLVIYSSIDRIPDAIGPVRSARPHFVKMAAALDMIYCHIGGSPAGNQAIKDLGVNDLGRAYEINATLKASDNVSWNRSAFTKKRVLSAVEHNGYKTTTSVTSPFQFGKKEGTMPATTVDVQISNSYDMAFTYDSESGLYNKHRNSLDTPVHVTGTGGTIAVSNVIVMYDNRKVDTLKPMETTVRYDFDLESGSGILASGGTAREIKWSRTDDGLQYFESDGVTPLTVATGKTFICLASDELESKTNIS